MNRRKLLLWGSAYAVGGAATWYGLKDNDRVTRLVVNAMADDAEGSWTSSNPQVIATRYGAGLDAPCWGFCHLPDGGLLVNEKQGSIRRLRPDGSLVENPLGKVDRCVIMGQGGLMDIELDPDFARNNRIWVSAACTSPQGGRGASTELIRLTLNSDLTAITEQKAIFAATPKTQAGQHFGGRIVFNGKGHVFLSLGDRGARETAQDMMKHNGCVVRLNLDGSVPDDNPFVGISKALPEIWTYGHRNPQGMAIHPATGEIWVNEHGPRGGDEVNLLKKGANYGWPVVSHGAEYATGIPVSKQRYRDGVEPPKHVYIPSIAPCGMIIYAGDMFPAYKGNILFGALRGMHLNHLTIDGAAITSEERLFTDQYGRIRSVEQAPDGAIWLLIDGDDEPLVRIAKA